MQRAFPIGDFEMNRTRFSVHLAAMSAMYTSGFRTAGIDCTDINLGTGSPPFALRGIGYNSDGTDTSLGAGGTEEAAKKDDIDGGTSQQQAQAENTGQVGGTEINSADKKVDEAGTGQVKAIGDPPDSQTQQV